MKNRLIPVVGLAIALVAMWWFAGSKDGRKGGEDTVVEKKDHVASESGVVSPEEAPPSPKVGETPQGAESPAVVEEAAGASVSRDPANPLVASTVPGAQGVTAANDDPEEMKELDKIVLMLRDYRTLMGENPVGTNAEIMKAIMGGNPKGAMVGPPEGMEVSGGGELMDRWGTPYFFHQLGKDLMEIHSAGADKVMGTGDDLMMK